MNKTKLSQLFQKIKSFVVSHKIWTGVIVVALGIIGHLIFGGSKTTETQYVQSTVVKGTVVASISGSGQVAASNQIDLKAKASGEVTYIGVKPGDMVKKGKLLFSVNARDAEKNVRDATLALQIARNDLENSRRDYENTKRTQELSLKNQLLNLNSEVVAIAGDDNTNTNIVNLSGSYNSSIQGRYTLKTYACQGIVCVNYSGLESGSFTVDVNVPKKLGERGLYATFTSRPRSDEEWHVDVPSPTSNSYLSNSRSYDESQIASQKTIADAQATITSRELSVTQKENALMDAKQALSDYYVTAPFDGTIASVAATVGATADTLGSIITPQKISTITLNEVDVAKVKLGQKATLSFDAIEDLTIAGEVVSIDPVGTVTQGVVNYEVKISFASDDDRVKPGMSVTASVVTNIAQDALSVPNSAIKTRNGVSYVEVFETELEEPVAGAQGSVSSTTPIQKEVEIGISNDTVTEIISGLTEGEKVVSRTITTTTKSTTTSAPSASSLLGGQNRGQATGGAQMRTIGR